MDLFCFSLSVLVLVAVVVEVLVAGIVEVVIVGCFDWRSEAFLEFFSIYGDILKDLLNLKYRSIIFNIQSEIFNDSDVSASIFIIAEL
jgi:hypothetical protein